MARDFSTGFYHSKAWTETRDMCMSIHHGICQLCGRPAEIVHHVRPLTPLNVNDPLVSLSLDNLVCVCRDCHAIIHSPYGTCRPGLTFDATGNLVYFGADRAVTIVVGDRVKAVDWLYENRREGDRLFTPGYEDDDADFRTWLKVGLSGEGRALVDAACLGYDCTRDLMGVDYDVIEV
jgi:hypothetical protein